MQFIETPIFTKAVQAILSDDEYRALQGTLMLRPEQGVLIKGSGGLRRVCPTFYTWRFDLSSAAHEAGRNPYSTRFQVAGVF